MRCIGRNKDGTKCKEKALVTSSYCRHHNSKEMRVRRNGRYGKNIPRNLLQDYEEAVADPGLVGFRDDIALLEARINELLGQMEQGESPELWLELRRIWGYFMTAIRNGDADRQKELVPQLNERIISGASKASAWKELTATVDKRRKVVESEQKRLVALQKMMAIEQVMQLQAATIELLRRVVDKHADRETAHLIFAEAEREYERLIGPPSDSDNGNVITVEPN